MLFFREKVRAKGWKKVKKWEREKWRNGEKALRQGAI
jgi:hypothetical protein